MGILILIIIGIKNHDKIEIIVIVRTLRIIETLTVIAMNVTYPITAIELGGGQGDLESWLVTPIRDYSYPEVIIRVLIKSEPTGGSFSPSQLGNIKFSQLVAAPCHSLNS